MTGFDRYARILALFCERRASWTVVEISQVLGTASSTVYRTVRELVAAGFLESTVGSHYRLGPAFVQYESTIRKTDPLVRSGLVFLGSLVEQMNVACTVVLARLHGERVMCVADAKSKDFTLNSSYERGRPMPILKGATSKAILAGLETRRRNRLLERATVDDPQVRESLRAELDKIRKLGFSMTQGEVDAGARGYAAPVRSKSLGIDASLSLIMADADFDSAMESRIISSLRTNSRLISNYLDDYYRDIVLRSARQH